MQWDDAVLLGEKEITKGIVNPIHTVILQLLTLVLLWNTNI